MFVKTEEKQPTNKNGNIIVLNKSIYIVIYSSQ